MTISLTFGTTQLRTGIDLFYNQDVAFLAEGPPGIVFTEREWRDVNNHPNRIERAAGKFACKEAVLKAMGCGLGEVELVDIEVCKDSSGKPSVCLHGSALAYWLQTGCEQLCVSISHHRDYSVAVAVAA